MSNPNRTEDRMPATFDRERALRYADAIDTLRDGFPGVAERALEYIRADLDTVDLTAAAAPVRSTVSHCPDASERDRVAAAFAATGAAGITR